MKPFLYIIFDAMNHFQTSVTLKRSLSRRFSVLKFACSTNDFVLAFSVFFSVRTNFFEFF